MINNMADENIYDEFKEAIPVMSGDTMDIAIDEAFAPIGQSNSELNHAVLNNRDIPNQHPITAIEGLRDELNNIENLKTEYSDEMGFANYYPWKDGGDSKDSRIGYFVAVADRERRIKICKESDEVFGVTVVTAGFIGNQDGIPDNDDYSKYGTKKGSNCGAECGLVAHSGVVNVHCRLDVVKGSHVICDDDGYAKVVPEEDGGYGFKVIGIDWKNGDKYAVISLDASINQLHALGKEALEIRNRMTGLEKNVTTAVNVANQALSKVNEIGEVSQGVAGKVDEIANVVDKNNQQIADTTNKVNQAVQQAQQAQQVAQEISNQVAENAKVEIQQLKDDVSKAQDVANTAKSTAEDAFLAAQNTKNEIQTNINTIIGDILKENEEYNKTVIEIQDLKASLNKAYKKIQSWNSSNNTYTSLDGKENQESDIKTVYYDGTNYYFNDGSWKSTTKISDTGLIASIAGMKNQVDENSASIISFAKWKGEAAESIAAIEQKANEDGSMIDLLCSYTGDNYEKVKSFNPANNNNDIKKIYYNEADRKFYYYKNGWKSTTKSYEAGITDAIANLKMITNDKESMIQILTTYIGKSVVDAVMCDSQPDLLNMKSGVKYCYQQDESSYICQFTDDKSAYTTYPEDSDLDTISNVVLNAVKEIDNYITVDTWTNDLEDSTEYTKIYYVKGQDKYYHWDTNKSAWLPMEISFYFTYNTDNKCWELTDLTSISFMKAISMIQSRANANGARLDVLLSGDTNDSDSLAAMIAEATGDTALMQMLTQWVDKSGVIEVKDEFDENTADKDKVYYVQGKESELKTNLILMPYDNNFLNTAPSTDTVVSAHGVNFRANSDGSIDVWGTATKDTIYNMRNYSGTPTSRLTINSGTYTIGLTTSELPPDFDSSYIRISTNLYTLEAIYKDYPATFSVSEQTKGCTVNLQIKEGFTHIDELNPIRVYPMLNLGSKLKPYTPPRVATTDDKEITLYYYYSNDYWFSTTDPSVAGVSNSLATLKVKSDKHGGEIEGLVKDTSELGTKLSRITQRADGIESLVANIDKYSVGEYSQAYGLSLEQANNILYDGMVFIPTKTVVEKYELEIEELSEEEYNKAFKAVQNGTLDTEFNDKDKKRQYHYYYDNDNGEIKDRYFYYNGTNWVFSGDPGYKNQSLISNRIYKWGDNEAYGCKTWIDTGETALVTITTTEPEAAVSGQFWYYNGSVPISITNSETGETRELYKPKALYKCVTDETDSTIKYWTFVTSADDNSIARSLSQIRQKSNEIALEVSDTKGSVATLKNTVDEFGAHTSLIVDKEGKVKAYILGDATESGSQWQIGATNINIDGTITVTNTYNTDRKGTFSIYDFAKDRNSSNNYWLRADLADGTTPFSVDETGKLTTTELLVDNCCSTISASSNGISLLVGDKNILRNSECFAGFKPTGYKVSRATMVPSISDTYVPSGKYSVVGFDSVSDGESTTRGVSFVETDILGQSTIDKIKPNTTYTLSFWLRTRSGAQVDELTKYAVIYAGDNAKVTLDTSRSITPTPTESWQKYVLTFKITGTISHFYIRMFFENCKDGTQKPSEADVQYWIDISSFKLEEGNIATDWTPGTNKGLFNMYTTKNDQGEVQSSIAIKGNTISIESDNFTLSNEGDITAISGKIGGWDIKLNSLVSQVATPKSEIKCSTIAPSEAEYSIDGIEYKKADVNYIYKIPFSNLFVSGYYYYIYISGSGYDIWITTPVLPPGVTKTQIEIGYWNSIKYKYRETEDSAQYQDMDTDKCYTYQEDENSVKSYYYYRDDQWVVETADPNYIVQLYGSDISNNIITAKSKNNNSEFFNIGKNGHIMCQNIKTPSITTNNNCITVSTITENSIERTNFAIGGQVVTIAGDENYRDIIQSNGGFLLRAGDGTKNWIAFAAAGYNFTNGDINAHGIKAAYTTTNLTADTTVCINNKYYNLSQILTQLNDGKKINFT